MGASNRTLETTESLIELNQYEEDLKSSIIELNLQYDELSKQQEKNAETTCYVAMEMAEAQGRIKELEGHYSQLICEAEETESLMKSIKKEREKKEQELEFIQKEKRKKFLSNITQFIHSNGDKELIEAFDALVEEINLD